MTYQFVGRMWRDVREIIKKLKKYKNTEILEKRLRDPNEAKLSL